MQVALTALKPHLELRWSTVDTHGDTTVFAPPWWRWCLFEERVHNASRSGSLMQLAQIHDTTMWYLCLHSAGAEVECVLTLSAWLQQRCKMRSIPALAHSEHVEHRQPGHRTKDLIFRRLGVAVPCCICTHRIAVHSLDSIVQKSGCRKWN